jgi:hypothetical protein
MFNDVIQATLAPISKNLLDTDNSLINTQVQVDFQSSFDFVFEFQLIPGNPSERLNFNEASQREIKEDQYEIQQSRRQRLSTEDQETS